MLVSDLLHYTEIHWTPITNHGERSRGNGLDDPRLSEKSLGSSSVRGPAVQREMALRPTVWPTPPWNPRFPRRPHL